MCCSPRGQKESDTTEWLNNKKCGILDGRGVWGRMDTCIYMEESLHCSSETITTLFVNWLYHSTTSTKSLKSSKYLYCPSIIPEMWLGSGSTDKNYHFSVPFASRWGLPDKSLPVECWWKGCGWHSGQSKKLTCLLYSFCFSHLLAGSQHPGWLWMLYIETAKLMLP